MRNKVWLLMVVLLAVHYSEIWGDENNSQSATIVQQVREKKVSGVVSDELGPITGATVMVKGSKTGVITDLDGRFTLNVPVGATIVVSFIGYEEKKLVFKGDSELAIQLN